MRMLALFLLLLVTSACGTSLRYAASGAATGPARTPRAAYQVEVLSLPPARAHVEIGALEAQKQWLSLDSRQDVLQKMRAQAGRLGCDAMVVTGGLVGSGGAGAVLVLGESGGRTNGYRAVCIVWKDAGAARAMR